MARTGRARPPYGNARGDRFGWIRGRLRAAFADRLKATHPAADDPAFLGLQSRVAHLIAHARREHPLGVTAYTPAAFGDTYPALYLRDFTYMAESAPEFIPREHVRGILALFADNLSPEGVCPERIGHGGEIIYICHGGRPAADSALFLVKLAVAHAAHGGDSTFLRRIFPSLVRAFGAVPVEASTGLVWIDPDAPHTAYGFTDTIAITGRHLYASLLRLEAARGLARLASQLGDARAEAAHENEARHIERHLSLLWSPEHRLFLAGSEDCRQADIWGSAYACVIGAVTTARRHVIAQSLLERCDRFLWRGQVRHLLRPESWQRRIVVDEWTAPGTFQNGPYWGTATGWMAEVFESEVPGRGLALLRELAADFAAHGVWECVGPNGYTRVRDNLSSACLPYASWKKLRGESDGGAG